MKNIVFIGFQEGVSGFDSVHRLHSEFTAMRLAQDINAAAKAAVKAGYTAYACAPQYRTSPALKRHWGNFLDAAVQEISIDKLPEILKDCAGAMLIGPAAKAGTLEAFLDCSYTDSWFRYTLNGKEMGEVGMFATFLGAYGVPVLLVSGCRAACKEASELIGGVTCVETKFAAYRNNATCKKTEDVCAELEEAAAKAVSENKVLPVRPELPAKIVIEYVREDFCDEAVFLAQGDCVRRDARTLEKTTRKISSFDDLMV